MLGVMITALASHSLKTVRTADIKGQRQSFGSSLEDFLQISHVRICCLIGVQRARCEDNYVSISFTQKLVRSAV